MRVILADDSNRTRLFLHRIISDAGHEVIEMASNGPDALSLCEKYIPDLALLDNTMTGGNGDAAAHAILDRGLAKNVVMISLDSSSPALKALKLRGVQVLSKPCQEHQVLAMLSSFGVA